MRIVAALVALLVSMSAARADDTTTKEKVEKNLGIALLLASGIMATTDTVLGSASLIATCDGNDCPTSGAERSTRNAMIGLAVASAVSAAVGIPLVVAARNGEKRRELRLGAAPVVTQGGGAMASLSFRF
jgi:hypothetical protein